MLWRKTKESGRILAGPKGDRGRGWRYLEVAVQLESRGGDRLGTVK